MKNDWSSHQLNKDQIHYSVPIYTHGILFICYNKQDPVICNNMNENKDQYVKRSKPNPERHMLHEFIYILNLSHFHRVEWRLPHAGESSKEVGETEVVDKQVLLI